MGPEDDARRSGPKQMDQQLRKNKQRSCRGRQVFTAVSPHFRNRAEQEHL
jgi:hypothetical protein